MSEYHQVYIMYISFNAGVAFTSGINFAIRTSETSSLMVFTVALLCFAMMVTFRRKGIIPA